MNSIFFIAKHKKDALLILSQLRSALKSFWGFHKFILREKKEQFIQVTTWKVFSLIREVSSVEIGTENFYDDLSWEWNENENSFTLNSDGMKLWGWKEKNSPEKENKVESTDIESQAEIVVEVSWEEIRKVFNGSGNEIQKENAADNVFVRTSWGRWLPIILSASISNKPREFLLKKKIKCVAARLTNLNLQKKNPFASTIQEIFRMIIWNEEMSRKYFREAHFLMANTNHQRHE